MNLGSENVKVLLQVSELSGGRFRCEHGSFCSKSDALSALGEGGLSSWRRHWTSKKGGGATRLFGDQADRVVWGPVDSA